MDIYKWTKLLNKVIMLKSEAGLCSIFPPHQCACDYDCIKYNGLWKEKCILSQACTHIMMLPTVPNEQKQADNSNSDL